MALPRLFLKTAPFITSLATMSDLWLGGNPADLAATSFIKVKTRILPSRSIDLLPSDKEAIRLKQCPSRHANTKPTRSLSSVVVVGSPSSPLTESIQITGEIFIGRTDVGHLEHPTLRFYRFVSTDPLVAITSHVP